MPYEHHSLWFSGDARNVNRCAASFPLAEGISSQNADMTSTSLIKESSYYVCSEQFPSNLNTEIVAKYPITNNFKPAINNPTLV
jgi:hypothetical protein